MKGGDDSSDKPGLVLLPHQEEGVAWMVNREHCAKCPGGLLLDDCGLGKEGQLFRPRARF